MCGRVNFIAKDLIGRPPSTAPLIGQIQREEDAFIRSKRGNARVVGHSDLCRVFACFPTSAPGRHRRLRSAHEGSATSPAQSAEHRGWLASPIRDRNALSRAQWEFHAFLLTE